IYLQWLKCAKDLGYRQTEVDSASPDVKKWKFGTQVQEKSRREIGVFNSRSYPILGVYYFEKTRLNCFSWNYF
ncbi:hypothetical protein MKX01_006112, partial [Papaver californicum]